jgi:hypothetical protein
MDTNGRELKRIRMGKGLTQGEALQFLIFVGPDLVSGRFGVSGAAKGNGLTQGEALQNRLLLRSFWDPGPFGSESKFARISEN